jgi:3-hydroxybutyryl-CoA dehydrogenase
MKVKRVFIMGAGVMGSGIARVTAQARYEVMVMDIEEKVLRNLATAYIRPHY